MSWTRDKCLALLDEYEKKEELWNPQHGYYYNKARKQDAWVEVASALGISAEDAKKKMDSLLSSFRREKAKGTRTIAIGGSVRRNVYKSKWFAFPRMQFLLDRDESRHTYVAVDEQDNCSTIDPDDESAIIVEDAEEEEITNVEEGTCNAESENVTVHLSTISQRTPTDTDRRRASKRAAVVDRDSLMGEALGILKTVVNQQAANENWPANDECSVYGQHVANKLRKYPVKIRDMVQYHINTVLYHADMGNPEVEISCRAKSARSRN